ncbi:hypothetical protein [Romboutsia ilealis]|uniref:hypothetical protein n=1 Tax=Romboutsia ilealis TaxID=1115758 RepID=UPI00272A54DF|nr:hypothetical protein [Romboutsia ilealis]
MAGFIFNEQEFVNDNIFKFENKLNSQYSRFLDKSPTYVTYYNISTIESTVDLGFSNIEAILGPNSPLKFKEIKDFPVYGLDSVQFDLEDEDEGLNSSFDSELIILPNTVKPLPNDFFIVNHLGKQFLFMVTSVSYDTIKSNNYYKIGYTIKSLDEDSSDKVKKQVNEVYKCIVENIGTEDKCLILEEDYELIKRMSSVYRNIAKRYLLYFYNKKYNSFLFKHETGFKAYDRYLTHFIQEHSLFNEKGNHETIMLCNEDDTQDFYPEYDQSIYRVFELRKPKYIKIYKFVCTCIENRYSTFNLYRDYSVKSVRYRYGDICYLHEPFLNLLKKGFKPIQPRNEEPLDPEFSIDPEEALDPDFTLDHHVCPNEFTEMDNVIVGYMHNTISSIRNIDLEELDSLLYFDNTWEIFIKIPLLLFTLKYYYKEFMKN